MRPEIEGEQHACAATPENYTHRPHPIACIPLSPPPHSPEVETARNHMLNYSPLYIYNSPENICGIISLSCTGNMLYEGGNAAFQR